MKHRFVFVLITLTFAVAVLLACVASESSGLVTGATAPASPSSKPAFAPGNSSPSSRFDTSPLPTPGTIEDPVTLDITLSHPIVINQPVIETITACLRQPYADMKIQVAAGGTIPIGLEHDLFFSLGDLQAGECRRVEVTLRFPRPGGYDLVVELSDYFGHIRNTSSYVQIRDNEIVVNPTWAPASTAMFLTPKPVTPEITETPGRAPATPGGPGGTPTPPADSERQAPKDNLGRQMDPEAIASTVYDCEWVLICTLT